MPKVSVIIPIYNVERFMPDTVQSVLCQSEKDIEVILVDDGSTDGSGAICDGFMEEDDRVRVIHKQNGGLSSARNAGIALASAEYVLLVDGDDYIHPQAVERLLAVQSQYPSDLIQFQYTEVTEVEPLPALNAISVAAQTTTAKEAFEYLYQYGGVCASACTKLFKKELLQAIPFDHIRHEDEMWCTRAFPRNMTITYIPDALYGYVMRQGSIIHSSFQEGRLDTLTIKQERRKTLERLGLHELLEQEWNGLFSCVFLLYKDAGLAENRQIQKKLTAYLRSSGVMHKAHVRGRMRLFYALARLRPEWSLKLYEMYYRYLHRDP